MAQGVAWSARELGVPSAVVVPDHAPATKLAAIERLGMHVVRLPFDRWWQVVEDHAYPGLDGLFVHPVSDPAVMAGNGTIGLEIVADLPDVDTVLVPFGGGGLSCGIAAALAALRPEARVIGTEAATAAPLTASLQAGEPRTVEYTASFVDGIGSRVAAPGDVAARAAAAGGVGRGLARADGGRGAAAGRAPPRDRGGRRRDVGGGGARRACQAPGRSSASSPAATSTPRSCPPSWPVGCPNAAGAAAARSPSGGRPDRRSARSATRGPRTSARSRSRPPPRRGRTTRPGSATDRIIRAEPRPSASGLASGSSETQNRAPSTSS